MTDVETAEAYCFRVRPMHAGRIGTPGRSMASMEFIEQGCATSLAYEPGELFRTDSLHGLGIEGR
jgi:hypothetical protein